MIYAIVWTSQYGREIVDTAKTLKEAKYLKKEYQLAFNCGYVAIKREWQVRGLK